MGSALIGKKCVPCEGGVPKLVGAEVQALLRDLDGWRAVDEEGVAHHLSKTFAFRDFAAALAFVNRVGALAEDEGHHPDLQLGWGRVQIDLHTHAIGGLSENDFILAAKTDRLPRDGSL